jgi:hypothetical protein
MMSHGHYGYGSHYNSGYYINDNDYNRYEHIGGSSVSDSAGSDYADGAVGSGFGDSQGKDDSVGSSFSDNS